MERSKTLRKVLKVVSIPVVLALLVLTWAWYLNQPPHFTITPPAVPADNALDYFKRARGSRQYELELISIRINWNENHLNNVPLSPSLPVILEANRKAVQIIREGCKRKYVIPLNPSNTSSNIWTDSYIVVGDCRRLLEINALYKFKTSEPGTAANAFIDLINFYSRIGSYPGYSYRHQCGYSQLMTLSDRLSVKEARAVVVRLESISEIVPSYADSLRVSKPKDLYDIVTYLSGNMNFEVEGNFNRWKWNRWYFGVPVMTPSPLEDRSVIVNQFYNWTVPNAKVPEITARYFDKCIRVAEQPFSAHVAYPPPPPDIVNWSWFAWDQRDKDHLQWLMWEFQHNSLMLSLALHGYRREHGRYPVGLKELVTDRWIKKVPVDPFTQQDAICYRIVGETLTLYSRGPDGKDDGGKPIVNKITALPGNTKREQEYYKYVVSVSKYLVHIDSHGDVVYGINKRGESGPMRL